MKGLLTFPPAATVDAFHAIDTRDGHDIGQRRPALLHTEIMREHLLVERDTTGRWRLSGLLDFEPAMIGHADYECAAIGVLVTGGDARLLSRFIAGYGRDPARDPS